MAGPVKTFQGESAEEIRSIEPPNYKGFSILQDSRILDLRPWSPGDSTSLVYGYRHLKVMKNSDNTENDVFRVVEITTHPETKFRFGQSQFQFKLRKTQEAPCRFEVSIDLSKVPNGQVVDVMYEHYSPGDFLQGGEHSTSVSSHSEGDVPEVNRWFLMPKGREYQRYEIIRYETGKPRTAEAVKGLTDYMSDDPSIIAFKLASVKTGYTFEITWFYK
jgi:hypothetical protein